MTLFHYRAAGTRDAAVLLGIQVPAGQRPDFDAAVAALGPDYACEPLEADAARAFDMFLS